MKNKYTQILFVISIILIISGLLLKILHYSIGFVTGYKLIVIGIIINIQVFFNFYLSQKIKNNL